MVSLTTKIDYEIIIRCPRYFLWVLYIFNENQFSWTVDSVYYRKTFKDVFLNQKHKMFHSNEHRLSDLLPSYYSKSVFPRVIPCFELRYIYNSVSRGWRLFTRIIFKLHLSIKRVYTYGCEPLARLMRTIRMPSACKINNSRTNIRLLYII